MVRILTRFFLLAVLLLSAGRAGASAFLGPVNETYQVPAIGHNLPGDIGAVKNLSEEYRWNRPVLYYAANQNFLDYFGSNGLYSVDAAFAIMNALTNFSSYSTNLAEFPQESMRENYLAQALGLYDIKSQTLEFLVEQMGLAEPERFVWCLHNRYVSPGGQCPQDMNYDVIKRNFDFGNYGTEQLVPTSYVNGTLYSYLIQEFCTGPPPLGDAVEFAVDPTANTYSAVASFNSGYGNFYTGLTRDDVAGLRYLLRTNNYNYEAAGADTITYVTNATPQILYTSNLTVLADSALTNSPAALLALFPDLQIGSSSSFFTNVVSTTSVFYFTNSPFDPAGTPPRLVSAPVVTTNIVTYYQYQFLNVFTNTYSTIGTVTLLTTNVSASACPPFTPVGTVCSNVSLVNYVTNGVFGDYLLLPTNSCGVGIVSTQLVINVSLTNSTVVATNAPGATNVVEEFYSQTRIYNYNQYALVVKAVDCPVDSVGLRQGMDRIKFVRRDFDSLLGRFFYPVTNSYESITLTNNNLVRQRVQRVITTPDLLLDATDFSPGPETVLGPGAWLRGITFDQSNANPGLAGPGTILPGATMTFNKVGPIYYNYAPDFLDETGQLLYFIWGSFDGTTNAPIVYPNGTDILNIENQVLLQLDPPGPALANALAGANYFVQFNVMGGTAPYSWTIAPGSGGLPPGLSLNPASGQITGVTATQNIYDFTIRMTDATSRYVDRNYSITVTP